MKGWRFTFPLTEKSTTIRYLLVIDPLWGKIPNPWWEFLEDAPLPEEERQTVWRSAPQVSPMPILCEVNHLWDLSERRMLEIQLINTCLIGNCHAVKLITAMLRKMG